MIIEILAVVFTLLSVWLTTKRNVMSWPTGLLAVIFYSAVFWQSKLYADFGLQFIFFGQGIYGLFNWLYNREDNFHAKIGLMLPVQRIAWLMIGMWVYLVTALLLYFYTDASSPWVDSFVAVFSLVANWLLARRKIENWIIWIVLDMVYVILFASKGLYLSSSLYLILLVLAIKGFKEWKKCLAI